MTLFHECSSAQIVLFVIGALFQFIAICAFLRERRETWNNDTVLSHLRDEEEEDDQPAPRPGPSIAQQVSSYHILPAPTQHEENASPTVRAADLLKTAKVRFKQNFKSLHHE